MEKKLTLRDAKKILSTFKQEEGAVDFQFPIIGMGASAGGLSALEARVEKMVDGTFANLHDFSSAEVKKVFHELEVHQIELEMQNEELRKTHQELYDAKARYYELYNKAPVCYCTLSEKGIIMEVNERTLKTVGLDENQLLMRKMTDFIFKEDQDILYLHQQKIMESSEPQTCEFRIVNNDGVLIWMIVSATADKDSNGNPIFRLVLNNIHERKMMEERLKNKEKMFLVQSRYAAMGEMISMIAHQWRQPLNIIGLAIANIQTKQAFQMLDKEAIDENTEIIAGNIAYMSDTIDDFRNFFKPDAPKELATMEDVITITLKVIGQSLLANNITIHIYNNSTTSLIIHKNSLVQVLLNIIGNAKDQLIFKKVESPAISISVDEIENKIALRICDNGGGISNEIIDKINQPYFTTKKLIGTGLGMYISQTIIEKHFTGTFTWYNQSDGACFIVALEKNQEGIMERVD